MKSKKKIQYNLLGRTGVRVSKLCLGTMNFGGRTSPEESKLIMDTALNAGINFIDTANVYGHEPTNFPINAGRSELIIGEYLEESNSRDKVILASKVFYEMNNTDINSTGSGRYHVMKNIEQSLERLQCDYLDLYQIHSPSNNIPVDETLRALNSLVEAGKIRYIGTSSYAAWQIIESLWIAKEMGLNRFISEQASYNLLDRRIERELLPMVRTYGIGILVWAPLAGGFLTGKYGREKDVINGRYGSFWSKKEDMFDDIAYEKLDMLSTVADKLGITLIELSLSWILHQPGITSAIIGPRTVNQLEENLTALNVELSQDVLQKIDEIFRPYEMTIPFYGPNMRNGFGHTNWGPHKFKWV